MNVADEVSFFTSAYSWFSPSRLHALLDPNLITDASSVDESHPFVRLWESFAGVAPRHRCHLLLEYAHLPNLLGRLDGATMGASVEGRVPYTDTDLVRYVSALVPELKFSCSGTDKPLLRQTFADLLPDEVLQRPKRAFDASLHHLFASADGRRELQIACGSPAMSRLFNRSALDMWMIENETDSHLQESWLMLSLSMWLNRNIL